MRNQIIKPPFILTGLILLFITVCAFEFQVQRRISVSVTNRVLRKGKVVTITSDIHYHFDRGTLLAHYYQPFEYYMISDARGEFRLYYPDKNEVFISRDPSQITDQSLLYFFFSNRISDMGLRDLGFSLFKTDRTKGVVTTWWLPPHTIAKEVSKVEMVHENYLPIYMAYHRPDNTLSRKVFYYQYTTDNTLPVRLPQKILEYNYLPDGDSLINQMSMSGFLFGNSANSTLFEFKIPGNAKVISNQ